MAHEGGAVTKLNVPVRVDSRFLTSNGSQPGGEGIGGGSVRSVVSLQEHPKGSMKSHFWASTTHICACPNASPEMPKAQPRLKKTHVHLIAATIVALLARRTVIRACAIV